MVFFLFMWLCFQAKGFELSYLEKVPEVKDTVHKQSLLHHVCSIVVEKFPESSDLYSEIGAITRSAKVSRTPAAHLQHHHSFFIIISYIFIIFNMVQGKNTWPFVQRKSHDHYHKFTYLTSILEIVHNLISPLLHFFVLNILNTKTLFISRFKLDFNPRISISSRMFGLQCTNNGSVPRAKEEIKASQIHVLLLKVMHCFWSERTNHELPLLNTGCPVFFRLTSTSCRKTYLRWSVAAKHPGIT